MNADIVVIGAGVAGITAVSQILDTTQYNIIWIDPQFIGGDIFQYKSVPANAKVDFFVKFTMEFGIYRNLLFNQEFCTLQSYYDVQNTQVNKSLEKSWVQLMQMTKIIKIKFAHRVQLIYGKAEECHYHEDTQNLFRNQSWLVKVKLNDNTQLSLVSVKHIVFCLGAVPRKMINQAEQQFQVVEVDDVLEPKQVQKEINQQDTVFVIGGSHTAILIIKTLLESKNPPKKIINFFISPVKYAVYHEDWIENDNTGLKGEVAQWFKKNQFIVQTLQRVQNQNLDQIEEQQKLFQHINEIKGSKKVIYAFGYHSRKLPLIKYGNTELRDELISGDGTNGSLVYQGMVLENCSALGIGFPEIVKDRVMSISKSVGFLDFAEYANKFLIKKINDDINHKLISAPPPKL